MNGFIWLVSRNAHPWVYFWKLTCGPPGREEMQKDCREQSLRDLQGRRPFFGSIPTRHLHIPVRRKCRRIVGSNPCLFSTAFVHPWTARRSRTSCSPRHLSIPGRQCKPRLMAAELAIVQWKCFMGKRLIITLRANLTYHMKHTPFLTSPPQNGAKLSSRSLLTQGFVMGSLYRHVKFESFHQGIKNVIGK
jgi:hypothetical protein